VLFEKSTFDWDTVRLPVMTAEPENGNPTPVPAPDNEADVKVPPPTFICPNEPVDNAEPLRNPSTCKLPLIVKEPVRLGSKCLDFSNAMS